MQFPLHSFDAETVAFMGRVCDEAWSEAQHHLSILSGSDPSGIRQLFAFRVMAAVSDGERDPDRLRKIALAALDA